MGLRCYLVKRNLSAFSDEALSGSESRKVAAHLAHCVSCGEEYSLLQKAGQVIRDLPQVAPRALPRPARTGVVRSPIPSRRRAVQVAGALATVIVAALLSYFFAHRADRQETAYGAHSPGYALDVDLCLKAMKSEGSRRRLVHVYQAQPITFEECKDRVTFPLSAPADLSGGLELQGIYLLQSGCCELVQLRYKSETSQADIFQQPLGHALFFGDKEFKDLPALPGCKATQSGDYQAIFWETPESRCVLVTDLPESNLAEAVARIGNPG